MIHFSVDFPSPAAVLKKLSFGLARAAPEAELLIGQSCSRSFLRTAAAVAGEGKSTEKGIMLR